MYKRRRLNQPAPTTTSLSSAQSMFMDGTFFTVPRLFYQLFTIFVVRESHVFPACFVLMTRKTTVLYKAVFEHITTLVPNFAPENVMADYEDASVHALREVCCAVWVMHNTTNHKLKQPIYICSVCMAFLLAVALS